MYIYLISIYLITWRASYVIFSVLIKQNINECCMSVTYLEYSSVIDHFRLFLFVSIDKFSTGSRHSLPCINAMKIDDWLYPGKFCLFLENTVTPWKPQFMDLQDLF